MANFKEQQSKLKTSRVDIRDGYYMGKVFLDEIHEYPKVKQRAGKEINDHFIHTYANSARNFINKEKSGTRIVKQSMVPRLNYFNDYITNLEGKDKMLINVGMMIEMQRAGYGDLDYYWQKLRFYAKDKGGYFRNPKIDAKLSSNFYAKVKQLRELGFITSNKVLNYRKITMKYSPVQQWVAIDKHILESKKTYKSFLLAVTEAYQLQGSYKNSQNKVTKFDQIQREWYRKQYKRSNIFTIRKMKFNDNPFSFYAGRMADSCLAGFLSCKESNTSISTKTLQRWRKHCRFNNYTTLQLYIPIKGAKYKDRKYRNNSKMYSNGKKEVYLIHVDRVILSSIPIFTIKSLQKRYLLSLYNGNFSKEKLPKIGTDYYNQDTTTILGLKKSIGKRKCIIFELMNDGTQKVIEHKIGNHIQNNFKDKEYLTSLGHKECYTQFKKSSLKKESSNIKKDIKTKYPSNVRSFVPSNIKTDVKHREDIEADLQKN